MPKLNVALMVVLSVAVIAIGGLLALDSKAPTPDTEAKLARLVRQLGDSDPDVRRDAESSLKRFGPVALPVLRKTAETGDETLAGRARKIIAQIQATPTVAPPAPEPSALAALPPAEVRLVLQMPQNRIRFGDAPRLYARIENGTPQAVLVARYAEGQARGYGRFAAFEITEPGGTVHTVPVDGIPAEAKSRLEIEAVAPSQSLALFEGTVEIHRSVYEAFSEPGTYRIRLVYDASEGSAYRDALAKSPAKAGLPLTGGRLTSNTLTLTVE